MIANVTYIYFSTFFKICVKIFFTFLNPPERNKWPVGHRLFPENLLITGGSNSCNKLATAHRTNCLVYLLTISYYLIQWRIFHNEEIMRTTLNTEDELIDNAIKLTGIMEKTSLVRLGRESLIARESAKRLALLGRSENKLEKIPRGRSGGT